MDMICFILLGDNSVCFAINILKLNKVWIRETNRSYCNSPIRRWQKLRPGSDKLSDNTYILKIKSTGICWKIWCGMWEAQVRSSFKDDSQFFWPELWKDEVTICWDRKDYRRRKFRGRLEFVLESLYSLSNVA